MSSSRVERKTRNQRQGENHNKTVNGNKISLLICIH